MGTMGEFFSRTRQSASARWQLLQLLKLDGRRSTALALLSAIIALANTLHASYRVQRQLKITVGVDNLLDKTYAEHLNLAGNAGFGFPANTRLNEPGRTLWLRADMQF